VAAAKSFVFNVAEYSGSLSLDASAKSDTQTGTTKVTGTLASGGNIQDLLVGSIVSAGNTAESTPTNGFTLIDGVVFNTIVSNGYLELLNAKGATSSGITAANANGAGAIASIKISGTPTSYSTNLSTLYEDGTALASQAVIISDPSGSWTPTVTSTATTYFFTSRPTALTWTVGSYSRSICLVSDTDTYLITQPPTGGTSHAYLWSIRDLAGTLDTGGYLEIERIINSVSHVIERENVIDLINGIPTCLQDGSIYHIKITDLAGATVYDFGYYQATTAQLNPMITLRKVAWSDQVQLTYLYVLAQATRPTNTQIVVDYNDTRSDTSLVELWVRYMNSTQAYYSNSTADAVTFTWNSANSTLDYTVELEATGSTFGTYQFNWAVPHTVAVSSPFNLSFFGTSTFNLNNLIPLFITLAAFSAFALATIGTGAIMGVGVAALQKALGWWNPDNGLLAFAMSFAIIIYLYESRRASTR